MVDNSFFEIPRKKKDRFEPVPLYIEMPMPGGPEELKPKEEDKEQRGVIIIELF
jgi:hypothetical protein